LQRQAILSLLLLGYVAEQATHGKGIAGLLTLAEGKFQVEDPAVGGVMPERSAGDCLTIERTAE
jgi:hypothetical protein